MSTPEGSAGDRTRERILAVSLPLFAAHGYDGTSVRTLAAAADVNVATLSYHFGGKEGLYRTVVHRLFQDLAALGLHGIDPGDDPLRAVVARVWAFARDHEDHIRLLHRHVLDRGAHRDDVLDTWLDPLLGQIDPWLGALRPSADATERRLIVMTLLHLVVRFVLEPAAQFPRIYGTELGRDDVVVDWLATLLRRTLQAPG